MSETPNGLPPNPFVPPETVEIVKVSPFVCPDCGAGFEKSQALGAHRARAHGYRHPRKRPTKYIAGGTGRPKPSKKEYFDEVIVKEKVDTYKTKLRFFLDELANQIVDEVPGSEDWTRLVTAYFLLRVDLV